MIEYPYIRKTSRYLFYAICSIGFSIIVTLPASAFIARDVIMQLIGPISIAAFLALRDLEKNAEARGKDKGSHP